MNNLNPLYEIYVLDENAFTSWLGRQTRKAVLGTALVGAGAGIGARNVSQQAAQNLENATKIVQQVTKPGANAVYKFGTKEAPRTFLQKITGSKAGLMPTATSLKSDLDIFNAGTNAVNVAANRVPSKMRIVTHKPGIQAQTSFTDYVKK